MQGDKEKITTIDDFKLGKALGIGQFGQVWLAQHKKERFVCAIKIINMSNIKENVQVKNIRREIEIHLNIVHKYIIQMYGYFYDSEKLYLVMEYCGENGDMFKLLRNRNSLEYNLVKKYIRQVAMAVEHLHRMDIIHRDIKPENILIDNDDNIKLCDFGWSVCNKDKRRGTFCGTLDYLSPEMCENKIYDKGVDVWCIGVLCYELICGDTPFDTSSKPTHVSKQIIIDQKIKYSSIFTREARDFIEMCCEKDFAKRADIKMVLKHDFLQ